jgi:TMEM175 potassium channel family protein
MEAREDFVRGAVPGEERAGTTPGCGPYELRPELDLRYAASSHGMPTSRLEAFSDGVFAIAATLLVLDLHVPETDKGLARGLLEQWPTYVAYVTSFLTIGIMWVNHHELFQHVHEVDRTLLFENLLLLMVVSITPFPTSVLGRYATAEQDAHIAAALYGVVMVAMGLAFTLLWRRVSRDRPGARRESLLFSTGLAVYAAAIGVSFLSAPLAMLLYLLMAVFYLFPWLPRPAADSA